MRFLLLCAIPALTFAQLGDLAENNASQWASFASDNATTSVALTTARVKTGQSAIQFTSASTAVAGVRYPAAGNANWNLSTATHLGFWLYATNPARTGPFDNGFRGNQPVVVLKSGSSSYRFTNAFVSMSLNTWRYYEIPLAGSSDWVRTQTGSPTFSKIDQIEFQHTSADTNWGITFDGVRFLDPTILPPAGPAPPTGVDAQVTKVKLLLIINNPIMTTFGNVRMNRRYNWFDPVALTNGAIADLQAASGGRIQYELVQTIDDPDYPFLQSGFQYTDATFENAWNTRNFVPGTFDYTRFSNKHGLGAKVDSGEVDEVWIYSFPGAGLWESMMAGDGAYYINGGPIPEAGGRRAFVMMGLNYERGVAEAIHSWGHRAENIMVHSYGSWLPNQATSWNRFTLLDKDSPGNGGVGNVHFPVNGLSDYDYTQTRTVNSNADDWPNYPRLTGAIRSVNNTNWRRGDGDFHRGYLNWWYARMPRAAGRAPDGYLANWWRYLGDVDQFKNWNGYLVGLDGIPTVSLTAPGNNATVTGTIAPKANASVSGALGRVDLYVDGFYHSSDYLSPFTYSLDTRKLSAGSHTLTARAYELQNGTETISAPVTINVANPQPAISPGLTFVPVRPCRVIDTRLPNGPLGGPRIEQGGTRSVPVPTSPCGIPTNAAAYAVNLTVVPPAELSYITLFPSGQPLPLASTLNSLDGRIKANAAIIPAGTNGAISMFASNASHVILDINGYFVPDGGLVFHPVTPCRIADTRLPNGPLGGPRMTPQQIRDFPVTSACGIPSTAQAYSLNMTVVPQGPLGFISTWPTGQTQPVVSTLNALTGAITANAALVPAGANGAISVFTTDRTDLIIDINGYFAPASSGGLRFYTLPPCRITDTRLPIGPFDGPAMVAAAARSFPAKSSACVNSTLTPQAYSLNATVVPPPTGLGYLTMWPSGVAQPLVSTLNALDGSVVANAAIVPAGTGGSISAFVTDAIALILDINGFFAP